MSKRLDRLKRWWDESDKIAHVVLQGPGERGLIEELDLTGEETMAIFNRIYKDQGMVEVDYLESPVSKAISRAFVIGVVVGRRGFGADPAKLEENEGESVEA